MLRTVLLALVASAVAENCGGSLSVDPRYCTGSLNGVPYCDASAIAEGDTVPLRIRLANNANYENFDGDQTYVPGVLKAGKRLQIVFACLDGTTCTTAAGDILEYTGSFVPQDATGAFFTMGPAPTFEGIDICGTLGNAATACGYVTLAQDIPMGGDETITVGQIYMKAVKYYAGSFIVSIEGEEAILETTGGICLPEELSASGAGTASGEMAAAAPPPPPTCDVTCAQTQCAAADCKETCAFPWATPECTSGCAGCDICRICETDTCQNCVAIYDSGAAPTPELQAQCDPCEGCELCSKPPPPPPPPPVGYACVQYNKCHKCDMLPAGACLYAGEINGPCYTSCEELPEAWVFAKKWGACSSMCPVSVSKDPHLHLPHGGRADFRGKDDTVFNLISTKDVTMNVLFEASDFAWATRLVHGTKMSAAYWVLRTSGGKLLSVEYEAQKYGPVAIVREEGHQDVLVRPGQPKLVVDDVEVVMLSSKTLAVATTKWRFSATSSPFPFGKLDANKDKVLLDVAIQPLYDADHDVVAPHGIIGQAYDGDSLAVNGRMDDNKSGESTTAAQAEGAIEGTWEDYVMAGKFATAFKFSRFGLAKAAPRDVSRLTGEKKAATAARGVVGASDRENVADAPLAVQQ